MKIAVLGSGNGGLAVAFDWAAAGHNVYIYDFENFKVNIDNINKAGGITSDGQMEGFQKIDYAGHDIKKVINGADIVFVVGPAYSTEPFGKACKHYVEKGQYYIVCPSSCAGAVVFKNAIGLSINDESVVVAETSTLPYAVRITGEAKISVYNRLKGGYYISALPSRFNSELKEKIKDVYSEAIMAKNILQTSLQNANPVIHPAVSLLNVAAIENKKGDLFFYEDGITPGVGSLMKAVDDERIKIGEKLGVKILPDPEVGVMQGYMSESTYDIGYSKAAGFKGIKAQESLDYRFFHEDVGYGLVLLSDLAKQIDVDVPIINALIDIISVVMTKDYRNEKARTMQKLGLSGLTVEELKTYFS